MLGLNYNHLRYFWAVAHDGNLTRTAQRLNLSQSALSVQIKKLEGRLGHALFERRGRQLHLTEAGRIALDHADAIFATGDDLIGTLRETGRSRQRVRVGALATLSRNFQIGFLRPVLDHADVEVVLRSGSNAELLRALRELRLDVVLSNQPPPNDDAPALVVRRIAEQVVSLIGLPSFAIDNLVLAGLLATFPLVLPTRGSSIRAGLDAMIDRLGIQPMIAAEVDDMAMMRLLAREGVGLAAIPPIVVADELKSGMLVETSQLPGISETFYAVTLQRRFPNPAIQLLLSPT